MSKIRRVDFSPDEWLAGTRELTLEERGAYWDVCALMYSRGGPIADDDRWIAKALAVNPRTWRAVKARLVEKGKLRIEADLIGNSRVFREIESAERRLNGARTAAEKSANARRNRSENDRLSLEINEIPEAGAHISERAITNHQPPTTKDIETQSPATAAPASPNGAEAPPDIKSAIFGPGLQWLVRNTGTSEQSCRSFLGSLISEHGEGATAAVLIAAERRSPVEPRSWMKRNIGHPYGTQRAHHDEPRRRTRAENAAAFAAAFRGPGDRGPADG